MRFGISIHDILDMEISEYHDWLAASEALELEDYKRNLNIAAYANPVQQKTHQQREKFFNKIQNKFSMIFGINPYRSKQILSQIERNTREQHRKREKWLKEQAKNDSIPSNSS